MRLLREGTKKWCTDVECSGVGYSGEGCGAKLRLEVEDLFITVHYDDGLAKEFTGFTCPLCGRDSDVLVPSLIREAARDRGQVRTGVISSALLKGTNATYLKSNETGSISHTRKDHL